MGDSPFAMVNEYFKILHVPHKELIWSEHSVHRSLSEEKEQFHELLLKKLLQKA